MDQHRERLFDPHRDQPIVVGFHDLVLESNWRPKKREVRSTLEPTRKRPSVSGRTATTPVVHAASLLGSQLIQRTTRSIALTDVGTAYAARCAENARAPDEANKVVTDAPHEPEGVLRITADPCSAMLS